MNKQASSRCCFVCGVDNDEGLKIRFYETESEPYIVTAEHTVPRQFQGYPGIVHGGILASMLDEVASRSVMRGDPPRFVVTARLSTRYRKPVPVETPLFLKGWLVEDKRRVFTVAGEIRDKEGTLLVEAEAVLVEVDPDYFPEMLKDQDAAWQVFPDEPDGSVGGKI